MKTTRSTELGQHDELWAAHLNICTKLEYIERVYVEENVLIRFVYKVQGRSKLFFFYGHIFLSRGVYDENVLAEVLV